MHAGLHAWVFGRIALGARGEKWLCTREISSSSAILCKLGLGRPPELRVWDGSRRNTVHESTRELAILSFKSWSSLQRYSRRFSIMSFNASRPCKLARTKEMANTIWTCPSKRPCRYSTNLGFSQPVLSTRVTQSCKDKKNFPNLRALQPL